MTTIYNRIDHNFTIVSNQAILDNRISGKAYKLYSYMVMRIGTCPSWNFNQKEIAKHFKEKKDSIYEAFNELIKNGWLVRKQKRSKGGKFSSSEFEIFSSPQIPTLPPCPEKPDTVKPDAEKPDTENPDYNKERLEENKDFNNNHPNQNDLKAPLTPHEKKWAYIFEEGKIKLIDSLSEEGRAKAKKNSSGWDIWYLAEIYLKGWKERGIPSDINKAFPAWCLSYTKGKKPD